MSAYTDAVDNNLDGLHHVSVGIAVKACAKCAGDHGWSPGDPEPEPEGAFSACSCDSCGSSLGGDRYAAHGFLIPEGEDPNDDELWALIHLEVCVDCLRYLACGDEPDNWTD